MAEEDAIFTKISKINSAIVKAQRDVNSANKTLLETKELLLEVLEMSRLDTSQSSLQDFDKSALSLKVIKAMINDAS
tara:strand:- start:1735 stop:1965 length:231 start_codon:yes stop_codon:yes gene_type:complete